MFAQTSKKSTWPENFTEIVPGNLYFGPIDGYIGNGAKIGVKLVLITNRKSYMSFPLVPKSVTLNDL